MEHCEVILVVDDEPMIRSLIRQELTESGYEVFEAGNGDEALGIVESTSNIDLILTDVRMPGRLNGFDLIERVLASYPRMRVIVMSGYTGQASTRFGLADRYLRKPFTMSFLERHIRELLAA